MSECTCNQTFRTGEDYRDHLPCDFGDQKRVKELEDEVQSLREEVRTLTAEKSQLERQVDRLENEIDQLHSDIHSDQYQGW